MRSEHEVLELLRAIYREVGGVPADLTSVRPLYGNWFNALRYELVRADTATMLLWRVDIDNLNRRPLTKALSTFVPDGHVERMSKIPRARGERTWPVPSRNSSVRLSGALRPQQKSSLTPNDAAARIGKRTPANAASPPSAHLLMLCGSCSTSREHVVAIAEESIKQVVVVARCDTCGATTQVAITGGSHPGRRIADRLKRATALSARRTANGEGKPPGSQVTATRTTKAQRDP